MRTADFNFDLPPELIAQTPTATRDESRLLVLDRRTGKIAHKKFRDLREFFRPGDVLVLNNSRVIPARLRGINPQTGGRFEILLLEENSKNDWWAMLRPAKRARVGTKIFLCDHSGNPASDHFVVIATNDDGHRRLHFENSQNILHRLNEFGEIPLPPYITRKNSTDDQLDRERYQTVYAKPAGSVAAPTAGLHFTEKLLDEIRAHGVEIHFVTLHVGPGTFAPVKTETLAAHKMHAEKFSLSAETAHALNLAKQENRRVFTVGTTTVRVLESVALANHGRLVAGSGRTNIFIYPPREFKIVDALITNFHLPGSTLLMLVSAFASPGETRGRQMILSAYAEAIRERYRFFSYGDAMLVL